MRSKSALGQDFHVAWPGQGELEWALMAHTHTIEKGHREALENTGRVVTFSGEIPVTTYQVYSKELVGLDAVHTECGSRS
jgi:hypothetical protein